MYDVGSRVWGVWVSAEAKELWWLVFRQLSWAISSRLGVGVAVYS
jgi:hypothetical protein